MLSAEIAEAKVAWKYLNGLINVYKPAGLTFFKVRSAIIHNLTRGSKLLFLLLEKILINMCLDLADLNELEPRPLRERVEIIKPNEDEERYAVVKKPNLADHVLATGPRYKMKDVKLKPAVHLGFYSSGVMLMGIDRKGFENAFRIRNNRSVRVFHITAKLGSSTETNFYDSRVVESSSITHVSESKLSRMIQSLQASHQKRMFEMAGVDLQSQTAYELAQKGWIRPIKTETPVIYQIKLVEFKKPYFTIEVVSINETEHFLGQFVHDMALTMRTHAHIAKLRCVRHGAFTIDTALTRENWSLQSILTNMALCNRILKEHPDMLRQTSPIIESY